MENISLRPIKLPVRLCKLKSTSRRMKKWMNCCSSHELYGSFRSDKMPHFSRYLNITLLYRYCCYIAGIIFLRIKYQIFYSHSASHVQIINGCSCFLFIFNFIANKIYKTLGTSIINVSLGCRVLYKFVFL